MVKQNRREKDMKLTLKENEINAKSLMVKHDILMKSTGLVSGREGVLETEKELYLMIAFVDTFVEENLIELCNQDKRSLNEIIVQDIEPIYASGDFNQVKVVGSGAYSYCKGYMSVQNSNSSFKIYKLNY